MPTARAASGAGRAPHGAGREERRIGGLGSAGLRVLLATTRRLSGAGGALRLFGLNETVREVFDISGFSTILAVFATEADALAGF